MFKTGNSILKNETTLRHLTDIEIELLKANHTTAESWDEVLVAEDFTPDQLHNCCLGGRVEIASGVRILNAQVRNYRLGRNVSLNNVSALECREESAFGNATPVAAVNECGGRTTLIHDRMTAQTAYMSAFYRHRPKLIARLDEMTRAYAASRRDTLGEVGEDSTLTGVRFVREVRIGKGVRIDGATVLQNGTILDGAFVGMDVKAYDFILAEGARIDNGVILERCFVGEGSVMDKNFTASDSLFFANSHCENGETASIFAGPYTVTHHKSSLLIAGYFSFFNAGSGSNQSNHLFKSGAVHQAIHLRGCKFASSAYVMSPAREGAFTMIMGHHSFHHDTRIFPYSYLVEREGKSVLMPGANLASYGAVRDVEKWPRRDHRTVFRDVINFEEYNPYITEGMLRAVDALQCLREENPDAASYVYNKVTIRPSGLQRGITLYNKAIVASLGAMLQEGIPQQRYDGSGSWIDLGGQYITKREAEAVADAIEEGQLPTFADIDNRLRVFHVHYADYARSWAEGVYASLLGHAPSAEEIAEAVTAGRNAHAALRQMTDQDCRRDCSMDMAVGYGIDTDDEEEIRRDYYTVRGLKS